MNPPANDNPPPAAPARMVRIIGHVGDGGRVVITDPDWRPAPARRLRLVEGGDGRPQP